MKVKLNNGKVIAIRRHGKLVRFDENSEPFSVSSSIGNDLIRTNSAVLVEDEVDYDAMKVTELRDLAKEHGLDASGTKDEIAKRLRGEVR